MSTPQISEVAGVVTDPVLRYTNSQKAVANVRLAFSDSKFNDQTRQWETVRTFWVDGTAWEGTAERLAEQVQKGSQVFVKGNLSTDEWTDQTSGEKRSKPVVTVQTFRVLSSSGASQQSTAPAQQPQQSQPVAAGGFGGFGGAPAGDDWGGGF